MTRNLKAFGLALVAAMALGAIGAQAASAVVTHSFRSSSLNSKTVLTGQNESYTTGNSKDTFTATGGVDVKCDATFSGTIVDNTVDTVTVHPKYHNCTSTFGEATVNTGGCNYEFSSDTTQAVGHSPSSEHATVSLDCESPHSASPHVITITAAGCILVFETTHNPSVTVNHSLHGVRYDQLVSHSGKHALTVTSTVRTIKYTALAGSLCGLVGHPAATYSNGSYDGTASVTGYEDINTPSGSTTNGTTWVHGAQVDITISTPT